ncbi:hypothetical protein EB001_17140 [bacterium]|nr:hypothetical protein [bacterium]
MGRIFAEDLASSGLDIEGAIIMHLQGNHYPPVPAEMAQACIDAITCYNDRESLDTEISLPEIDGFQVTYKGSITAPAWSIIQQHHLDPWLIEDDEPIWDDED